MLIKNKIILLLITLVMSGCHTTGHNPYGDSEVFNSIVITAISIGLN
tara:strand:- start:315 stop:455 length:141 start_codon:yes stop_codon:yes gene_type:complete